MLLQGEVAVAKSAAQASARGAKETGVRAAIEKDYETQKATAEHRELLARVSAAEAIARG